MIRSSSRAKHLGTLFLGLVAIFCMLAVSSCGKSYRAQVYDSAHVLNTHQIQRNASNMRAPMAIYTTNTFGGTASDFQRAVTQKLNGNPNMIVMGIDTANRYTYIARGANVKLSQADLNNAVNAFSTNFGVSNYNGATLAAVNSMQRSLGGPADTTSLTANPGWFGLMIPLLLILGGGLFMANRRRSAFQMARPAQGMPYRPTQPGQGTRTWGETNRGTGTTFGEPSRGAGTTFGETNRGAGTTFGEPNRGAGTSFGETSRGAGGKYGEPDYGMGGSSFGSKNIRGDGSLGGEDFPERNDTGKRF